MVTSELTGVNHLAFNFCSTRQIVVESTPSIISFFPRTASLRCLTSRSQIPLIWGAAGEFNYQLIPCWTHCTANLSLLQATAYSLVCSRGNGSVVTDNFYCFASSSWEPHTCVQKIGVSSFIFIFRRTACNIRHVNKQHCRFLIKRPFYTVKRPK